MVFIKKKRSCETRLRRCFSDSVVVQTRDEYTLLLLAVAGWIDDLRPSDPQVREKEVSHTDGYR